MTRLFYEQTLQKAFPGLQWVRVCTSAPFTVTVYACDANLDLSAQTVSKLSRFLSENALASNRHIVKHYFELRNDEAFPIGQIPDCVKDAALKGNATRAGVQASIKAAFPFVDSNNIEVNKDTVTFHLLKDEHWTPYQVKFVELMLSEIIPAGTTAKLAATPLDA